MIEGQGFSLQRFLIRLAAITIAAILVLYLVKVWFVDEQQPRLPLQGNTAKQEESSSAKTQGETKPHLISWRDASRYYGEHVTVEGKIVLTHNSGNACFLNFHRDYKSYFSVVIFASSFPLFPANPENFYQGKEVHVTGRIKEYEGRPEMVLNDPSQIEILRR